MAWFGRLTSARSIPRLGERGERAAARYLRRRGYKLLARKQRNRLGELDLVVLDGDTVVFVEVKTRTSTDRGHPAEAVTADKQRRLTRLALGFLKAHALLEYSARFDVVAVIWAPGSRRPTIEHFPDAFDASGRFQMYS